MLHDYELGYLSEDDQYQFELHLYECEYCASQVRGFIEESRIMKTDPEARKVIAGAAKSTPKVRKAYLRLLMAAVLVLIVAVPVYKLGMVDDVGEIHQTLELFPTRSGGTDVIYLDRDGSAEIRFYANNSFRDGADILLSRFEGDTVRHIPDFSDFTEDGFGALIMPLSDLHEGHYILKISSSSGIDSTHDIQYMFRVK